MDAGRGASSAASRQRGGPLPHLPLHAGVYTSVRHQSGDQDVLKCLKHLSVIGLMSSHFLHESDKTGNIYKHDRQHL